MSFPRIQRFIRNLVPPDGLEAPPGTIKLVLYAIGSRADANTLECFPSRARLAIDTGVSEATVKRALRAITKAKLVVRWRRKRNDGTLAGWHYRLVIDGPPSGWEMADETGGENVQDIQRGVSLTPPKKSNNSSASIGGQLAPQEGVSLARAKGQPDPSIRTSEEPIEQPHTQQASVESHVSEKCYQVADRIRARWPKEALKGSGLEKLPALVAAASEKSGRSPEKVEAAAIAYLKKASISPRPVTWLGAWFEREEYLPHMPKLSPDERRRGDDATYTAALERWLAGSEWPEKILGQPPGKPEFWAPFKPIASVLKVAADGPRLRTLVGSLQAGTRYPDAFDQLDRWDYDFRGLQGRGVWEGSDPDPRSADSRYPAYLYERHGVARPGRPTFTVVAA